MRVLLLFFSVIVVAWANTLPPSESARVNREAKDEFDHRAERELEDADLVVVRALLPPIEGAQDSALIVDRRIVRGMAKRLRSAVSASVWHRLEDGTLESLSLPCQCWGEFEIQFFGGKHLLASISLHHWTHIRSEKLTGGADVQLEVGAIDFLYEVARTALPEYGKRTKKPNQSLEPTPTAGTSAAEQPLVPAAVVAHL